MNFRLKSEVLIVDEAVFLQSALRPYFNICVRGHVDFSPWVSMIQLSLARSSFEVVLFASSLETCGSARSQNTKHLITSPLNSQSRS